MPPYVKYNDGQGQFSAGHQVIRYGHFDAAALGDVTGDGLADVVVATGTTVRVWANDGRGGFVAGPAIRFR